MITNGSSIQSLPPNDGYVDYSDVGLTFKASESYERMFMSLTWWPSQMCLEKMVYLRV